MSELLATLQDLPPRSLIAGSNVADQPDVLVVLAGDGLIGMAIVMPLAAEFGKRAAVGASAHETLSTVDRLAGQ